MKKDTCYFNKAEINIYKDGYLDGLKEGRKELEKVKTEKYFYKKDTQELQKENEYLDKVNNEQTEVILELQAQIEKMKCCGNCIFQLNGMNYELGEPCYRCEGFSNWEMEKMKIEVVKSIDQNGKVMITYVDYGDFCKIQIEYEKQIEQLKQQLELKQQYVEKLEEELENKKNTNKVNHFITSFLFLPSWTIRSFCHLLVVLLFFKSLISKGVFMNKVEIKCKTENTLELADLTEFQGGLKARTDIDYDKIKLSIVKYGFSFPFFIWKNNNKNMLLDGHGRFATLCKMQKDGYEIPPLPVVYVDCKNEKEAKEKLLRLNSQYGKMTKESVLEFAGDIELNFEEIALPDTTIDFSTQNEDVVGDDDFLKEQEDVDFEKANNTKKICCPNCGLQIEVR